MNFDQLSPRTKSRIETAQIKECCRKLNEVYISAVLAVLFSVFLAFGHAEQTHILIWASLTLVVLAVRFVFVSYFARLATEQVQRVHLNTYTLILLVWGLIWAIGTLLFFPLLPVLLQAAWFAMFTGMVAAAAASLAIYLPAFLVFAVTYFIGIAVSVMISFPSPYHVNVLAAILILITQIGAAKKGNRVMMESLILRFKNYDLIDELKKQKNQAEKANLSKSKFLAAASHDLRQPLHALTLFSGALRESLIDPQKALHLIDQINESIQALQELFNALLDISRLDAGTLICEKVHFNSRNLLEKLQNDFAPVAKEKGLSMHWETSPTALYSDPVLLELILRNLVSNALRYTDKGSVEIKLIPKGEQVCIDVIDSGVGITQEHQDQIFDEFVQLQNPERDRNKGLGLGLSIVRRVAKLLGTTIQLYSIPGKGTTFSVAVDCGDPTQVASPAENTIIMTKGCQASVLVIDDEVTILNAMGALLESWGYQVILADDLAEALDKLQKENIVPGCIIADYRLREENTGLEAIEVLRQHFGIDIPAIVVSGDIAKERIVQIKQHGLQLLHKPVPPARLRSFLHNQVH